MQGKRSMLINTQPGNVLLNYLKFHILQLCHTISSQPSSSGNSAVQKRMSEIQQSLNSDELTLQDCSAIEQELLQLYPNALYPTLYLDARQKFSQILPVESVAKLKALETLHPVSNAQASHTNVRIHTATLFRWIQDYYYFINSREIFIHQMKMRFIAMLFLLIAATVIAGVFCLNNTSPYHYSILIGMAFGGYLGAIISTVQRLQNVAESSADGIDREATLVKIYQGKTGIQLSILLGTLAPFIVFLLTRFVPNDKGIVIFGISLLPRFNEMLFTDETGVSALYLMPEFVDVKDIAKILFISILSGFSERLVPDVLDRISHELNNQFSNGKQ